MAFADGARSWPSDGSSALSSPSGIKEWWEPTRAENASAEPPETAPLGAGRLSSVGCGEPPADDAAFSSGASTEPLTSAENAIESATATQAFTGRFAEDSAFSAAHVRDEQEPPREPHTARSSTEPPGSAGPAASSDELV
ncbi:hypothetical protein, partial [Planotetraspora thailandica]|uniref:hypothetical protein n=1 Tax=Planotetraspora thailandica TaxID=487172 RepID=UPI001951E3AD